ncbi:response regulator transcription factor [Ectothiorhodospiraceae bacterium 2226]|nr:response regulator transcription factor [Ectothiorhodospiraceae bacterium 2226]
MKLLLVDDHALFRAGLKSVLPRLDGSLTLAEAGSCEEGLQRLREAPDADLVLLDLGLGDGKDRLHCLRRFRQADPTLPIVIVSAHESRDTIAAAVNAGASGYIPKSSDSALLIEALRLVLAGGIYLPPALIAGSAPSAQRPPTGLTPRQQEVLALLAEGLPNKAIARRLGMAEGTVRIHVTAIIKHLHASNRTEALAKAIRLGYVATLEED